MRELLLSEKRLVRHVYVGCFIGMFCLIGWIQLESKSIFIKFDINELANNIPGISGKLKI